MHHTFQALVGPHEEEGGTENALGRVEMAATSSQEQMLSIVRDPVDQSPVNKVKKDSNRENAVGRTFNTADDGEAGSKFQHNP